MNNSKQFTLKKLLNQYKVEIPIIQRDYAQGREGKEELRNSFLSSLHLAVTKNKNLELDFVYGDLRDGIFKPLDGQQRLTTLFLLHWYAAIRNLSLTDKMNTLSKFTYETRTSSREFCENLVSKGIIYDEAKLVSKLIFDSSWFFLSWKNDPTIQSMLTMLDAIHETFKHDYEDLWNKLDKISFHFIELQDFGLSDDLYIKMNARGKPLTDFENFKAKFEQYIRSEVFKKDENDNDIYENGERILLKANWEQNLKPEETFAHKIDTTWADLFWNYKNLVGENNVYDEEIKNIIRVLFTQQYAVQNSQDENLDYLLGTQTAKRRKDYSENISFKKYQELNVITESNVSNLVNIFDALINGNKKINTYLSEDYKFYFDEHRVFENVLKNNFSNNQERVMFFGYTNFLIQNKNERTGIEQWMRVLFNLVNNTIIDGSDDISKAIKSIKKLLPNSAQIIRFLVEDPQIDFFSSWQILEEKIKASLLTKDSRWKNKIESTEKFTCFNGQIGFILEFAGIIDYFQEKDNLDWKDEEDDFYYKIFEDYADKSIAVFNDKNKYDVDYVWERAVLTKGNYLLRASSLRRNFLTSDRNVRDFSWKRLLRITDENKKRRNYVKNVLDDNLFNISEIEQSLKSICEHRTNTWRDYIISDSKLISICNQGFIRFENEHDIILLAESQMNHYHTEMYTTSLFCKYFEDNKEKFTPFKVKYEWSRSSNEDAFIKLSEFILDEKQYEIHIYYCNNDELKYPYEIAFKSSKPDNVIDESLEKILLNLEFNWEEKYNGYFFTIDNEIELMQKINGLIEELKEI